MDSLDQLESKKSVAMSSPLARPALQQHPTKVPLVGSVEVGVELERVQVVDGLALLELRQGVLNLSRTLIGGPSVGALAPPKSKAGIHSSEGLRDGCSKGQCMDEMLVVKTCTPRVTSPVTVRVTCIPEVPLEVLDEMGGSSVPKQSLLAMR